MNNGDIPASPTKHDSEHFQNPIRYTTGLTKREHFAAMAMQGILASAPRDDMGSNFIAEWSLDCADELLKALENNNED